MRTSIFAVGLLIVSVFVRCTEAVYSVEVAPNEAAWFYAVLLIIFMAMDITDFSHRLNKA